MAESNKLPLICFDLGRVLIRICDNWAHACEVAGLTVKVPYPLDDAAHAAVHQLVCDYETGRLDADGLYAAMAPIFKVQPAHVEALWEAYVIDVYPGANELVDDVQAAGYTTACLSNVNPMHWSAVSAGGKAAGPVDRLMHRFASHLIGFRKPDAGAYEHVERETGYPGSQIVFFDDMPENIAAAKNRGWRAELILRDGDPVKQMRTYLAREGLMPRKP